MVSSNEIREKLARYLAGDLAREDFEDWFVQNSWNVHRADPETRELAHAIELRLSEFSSGHLTEKNLRDELRALVTCISAQVVFNGATVVTGESSDIKWQTVVRTILPAGSVAGIEYEVEYA